MKSTQLASLLLTNASHEGMLWSLLSPHILSLEIAVRTPLNQIIGFLELALEANLDDETRNNLGHAHTASKVITMSPSVSRLSHTIVSELALHDQRSTRFDTPRIRSPYPVQRHL